LVASGETSWHLYARFVIEQALERGWELQATPQRVLPIATEDYPVPAKRPANSRLDNRKLQQVFGLVLPDWRYHAGRMIQELSEQGPL
ncbi:sugar nucleotide-binding protein, partial [Pseudomonas aeruginosa]